MPIGDEGMVDLGVALTWIAISAASAKGLSVLVRAAATSAADAELAALTGEGMPAHDAQYHLDIPLHLLRDRL
jgi:hypothetical protein